MEALSVLQRELVDKVAAGVILAALLLMQEEVRGRVGSEAMVVLLAVAAAQEGKVLSVAAPPLGVEEVMVAAVQSV